MNKNKLFSQVTTCLLISTIVLAGCQPTQPVNNETVVKPVTTSNTTASVTVTPAEETTTPTPTSDKMTVDLKVGESKEIGKAASITFDKVDSDSRCPTGTQCIWAGEAKVIVSYKGFSDDKSPLTISNLDGAVVLGENDGMIYSIQLMNLIPHPDAKIVNDRSQSTATFELTSAKK